MPRNGTVTLDDGSVHVYQNVPDDVTPGQVTERASREFGKGVKALDGGRASPQAAAPVERSATQQVGDFIRDIPRQVGLTARYGIEGAGQMLDTFTNPIRGVQNYVAEKAAGSPAPGQKPAGYAARTSEMATALANKLGLPQPQTDYERVIGDASRAVVGTVAGAKGAQSLAGLAASPTTRAVLTNLASNPGTQATAAAAGAGASGTVRESGGSPGEQFAAGFLTSMAAPSVVQGVQNAGSRVSQTVRNALTPKQTQLENVDQQISLTLKNQGIDWSTVAPNIKAQIREEALKAMDGGAAGLDPAALRRLLVFRNVPGTKPTVGMLKQDPGLITREKNLAKVGANSTDRSLQALPNLESENTAALLNNLDEAGARNAPNAFRAGEAAIGSLQGKIAAAEAKRNALYDAARNATGRDVELDGYAFTKGVNDKLAHDLAPKLGGEVDGILNDIASGKTPLTVEYSEQLKKALFRKIQSAKSSGNGDLAYAYQTVRNALDTAPIKGMPAGPNLDNLPALAGGGSEAMQAFKAARQSHAELMGRLEKNPAMKAVFDGAEPDRFMQQFVVGNGATAADLKALRGELSDQSAAQVRAFIVGHLKDQATGGTTDINKFSSANYDKALKNIGDEKLAVFFSPDELKRLKDIGQAGRYMQAQPAGAAVNNSNSGAMVSAQALDALDAMAGKVPLAGGVIQGVIRGKQQRQVMTPTNALARPVPQEEQPRNVLNLLALPSPF